MTAALNPCPEHTKPIQSAASCGSREARAPLDGRHRRFSLSKRRRWESNPLKAALQAAAFPSGSDVDSLSIGEKCPHQDSNLILDLRRVACDPPHSEDVGSSRRQYPAEDSNLVRQLRRLPCVPAHSQGVSFAQKTTLPQLTLGARHRTQISRPGIEPGPGPSEGPMRSVTPSRLSMSARSRTP
jgi:hypothetical protein